MRCIECLNLITEARANCPSCGTAIDPYQPTSMVGRLKRSLGIEISSELITLSIDEPDNFFSDDEIDRILSPINMKPLDVKDVPNWELMFFSSKRVKLPVRE